MTVVIRSLNHGKPSNENKITPRGERSRLFTLFGERTNICFYRFGGRVRNPTDETLSRVCKRKRRPPPNLTRLVVFAEHTRTWSGQKCIRVPKIGKTRFAVISPRDFENIRTFPFDRRQKRRSICPLCAARLTRTWPLRHFTRRLRARDRLRSARDSKQKRFTAANTARVRTPSVGR